MDDTPFSNPPTATVWRPEVHQDIGESLYFVFVSSYLFHVDIRTVHQPRMASIIGRQFPIFITYGFYDVWMYFWANRAQQKEMALYLKNNIDGRGTTDTRAIFEVDRIWRIQGLLSLGTRKESVLLSFPTDVLDQYQQESADDQIRSWVEESGFILGVISDQDALHSKNTKQSKREVRAFLLLDILRNIASPDSVAQDIAKIFEDSSELNDITVNALVRLGEMRETWFYIVDFTAPEYHQVQGVIEAVRTNALRQSIRKTSTYLVSEVVSPENGYCDFSFRSLATQESALYLIAGPALRQLNNLQKVKISSLHVEWQKYWHNDRCRQLSLMLIRALAQHTLPTGREAFLNAVREVASHLEEDLRDLVQMEVERYTQLKGMDAWQALVAQMSQKERYERKFFSSIDLGDASAILSTVAKRVPDRNDLAVLADSLNVFAQARNSAVHKKRNRLASWEDVIKACESITAMLGVMAVRPKGPAPIDDEVDFDANAGGTSN